MPLDAIHRELARIGKLLNYWQAELFASAWLAIFFGLLWLGGFSDLFVKWGPVGRIGFWVLTVAAFGTGTWFVWKALSTRRTSEAIAARVEQVFPQLDNRLINVIQFEAAAGAMDPIRGAYLRQGVPNWSEVNPAGMRDREKHKRAYIALGGALLMLLLPFLFTPASWGNALARILNPFSSRAPITVAHILGVTPGDGSCVTGQSLTITVSASGRAGQPVSVDLWPTDDKASTVHFAQVRGGAAQEDFSYVLPKVSADLDYRVRVGDAASGRYHIKSTAPLSYAHADITVTPPKGMNTPAQHLNGLTDEIVAPQGSQIAISLEGNRPLAHSFISLAGGPLVQLSPAGRGFTGSTTVSKEGALVITSDAEGDERLTASVRVRLAPDLPPAIRIISPQGRGILGVGADPLIQFEATDDIALTKVAVEQCDPAAASASPTDDDSAPGKVIQEWPVDGQRSFAFTWRGNGLRPKEGQTACFRIVAYDNFAGDKPHRTASPTILFQTADPRDLSAAAVKMAGETQATLDKLVALQTENLARSRGFAGREAAVPADQWAAALAAQKQVRDIAGALISDPRKPLAALEQRVEPLYQHEMPDAITLLGNAPTASADSRPALLEQAITKEDFILHVLSGVDTAFSRTDRDRRISDVLALMDALVHNQADLNTSTAAAAAANATTVTALTQKQDHLSGDVDAFIVTAKSESDNLKGSDAGFAEVLGKVAGEFATRNVSTDMLRASEQLDNKAPAKAEPIQQGILKNLQDLQAMLSAWRAENAAERAREIKDAFEKAAAKIQRMADMQAKVVQSMKQWKAQENQTKAQESDQHEDLVQKNQNMKEAMFQIAADLQIFPEFQLGNDVVKDVTTQWAKVDQVKNSEHELGPERDLQKEDWLLKDIDKMAARIKDGLPTLPNTPTNANFTTEDFDKQEFPGKIAAVPNADKFEDLIGDLLKMDNDILEKTKSSATNQAQKDGYMEGPVAEGEWANYSAKGKSGNNVPKNNEQSGRSNVGRQGMSNGETAAGAGKINKGDDNIKKRMTQDSAQSGDMGKIDDSEAKAVATGGGKISGHADEFGMAGNGPRRDAKDAASGNGMSALMKKRADAIYAAASLQHVRTGSLDEAITHLRDAEDAEAQGKPIEEVREYQRLAREALKRSQVTLQGGLATEAIDANGARKAQTAEVAGASDEAPAAYQQMVSDYYKSINNAPQK